MVDARQVLGKQDEEVWKVYAIGVKTVEGTIVPLKLNHENKEDDHGGVVFTTVANQQKKALFEIYCRDNEISDWRFIKCLLFEGIPPDKAGNPTLELSVSESNEDTLLLQMLERTSFKQAEMQISRCELAGKHKDRQVKGSPVPEPGRPVAEGRDVKAEKPPRRKIFRHFVFLIIAVSLALFLARKLDLSSLASIEQRPWTQKQIERVERVRSASIRETEKIAAQWLGLKRRGNEIIENRRSAFTIRKDGIKKKIEAVLQERK